MLRHMWYVFMGHLSSSTPTDVNNAVMHRYRTRSSTTVTTTFRWFYLNCFGLFATDGRWSEPFLLAYLAIHKCWCLDCLILMHKVRELFLNLVKVIRATLHPTTVSIPLLRFENRSSLVICSSCLTMMQITLLVQSCSCISCLFDNMHTEVLK